MEREEYMGARSASAREDEERDGADLLEWILNRNNLNRAYKQVKRNHGALGIDEMTVKEASSWLREHSEELLNSIRDGKDKPNPVRRKEIPKPDRSGMRKLGIPTVIDRIIQQAIAQQLQPIFEPLFSDGSYGYRPKRSAQQAIRKVKEYAEQGYTHAVEVDLSKYFDTLNHELLMNLLRRQIHDKRVTELIKKYLKSGVMENGVLCKAEEGSPQGGPLSPLLANIYLNEFDQEMESRGVKVIRYAGDVVVLAKSKRAAERLLKSSRNYLENKLRLEMNAQKSRVVSVVAQKYFKFLGFAFGKNGNGIYIRAHRKALVKAKRKLKELTCRSQGRNVRRVMENVKGLYSRMAWKLLCGSHETDSAKLERVAAKKIPHVHLETMEEAENKGTKPVKVGRIGKIRLTNGETPGWATGALPEAQSYSVPSQTKNSRWPDIMTSRHSMSSFVNCTYAIEPPCTERYARWCERSVAQLVGSLLHDCPEWQVHHGKLVQAWLDANKTRIEVFYLPPYAPEHNPDE